MTRPSRRFGINGRTVLLLFALAAIALCARRYVLAPTFRDQVGFVPFDLQPGLNRETIVIQLGAAAMRQALAYLQFAVLDTIVTAAVAAFTVVLWLWLFRRAPNRVFALFHGGGIVLLPLASAALAVAEHLAVYRLLEGVPREGFASAVGLVAGLHGAQAAARAVESIFTAAFILIALAVRTLRRRRASG